MKISSHVGCVDIKIDTSRIEGNIREAQKLLNIQIATDCEPFIPFQQGALRGSQIYPEGIYGGEIEYNTPYAHYIYTGELYLAENGSSWARKYEKKSPAGKALAYQEPDTTAEWFKEAKREHGKDWVRLVKETVGKQ